MKQLIMTLLLISVMLTGCGDKKEETTNPQPTVTTPESKPIKPEPETGTGLTGVWHYVNQGDISTDSYIELSESHYTAYSKYSGLECYVSFEYLVSFTASEMTLDSSRLIEDSPDVIFEYRLRGDQLTFTETEAENGDPADNIELTRVKASVLDILPSCRRADWNGKSDDEYKIDINFKDLSQVWDNVATTGEAEEEPKQYQIAFKFDVNNNREFDLMDTLIDVSIDEANGLKATLMQIASGVFQQSILAEIVGNTLHLVVPAGLAIDFDNVDNQTAISLYAHYSGDAYHDDSIPGDATTLYDIFTYKADSHLILDETDSQDIDNPVDILSVSVTTPVKNLSKPIDPFSGQPKTHSAGSWAMGGSEHINKAEATTEWRKIVTVALLEDNTSLQVGSAFVLKTGNSAYVNLLIPVTNIGSEALCSVRAYTVNYLDGSGQILEENQYVSFYGQQLMGASYYADCILSGSTAFITDMVYLDSDEGLTPQQIFTQVSNIEINKIIGTAISGELKLVLEPISNTLNSRELMVKNNGKQAIIINDYSSQIIALDQWGFPLSKEYLQPHKTELAAGEQTLFSAYGSGRSELADSAIVLLDWEPMPMSDEDQFTSEAPMFSATSGAKGGSDNVDALDATTDWRQQIDINLIEPNAN